MTRVTAAWLLTVVIEAPCVALFYPSQRAAMLLLCAVTTTITNLAMNWLLPRWLGVGVTFLVVGEMTALVGETAIYWLARRPHDLARATAASALANALSFGAGALWHLP